MHLGFIAVHKVGHQFAAPFKLDDHQHVGGVERDGEPVNRKGADGSRLIEETVWLHLIDGAAMHADTLGRGMDSFG